MLSLYDEVIQEERLVVLQWGFRHCLYVSKKKKKSPKKLNKINVGMLICIFLHWNIEVYFTRLAVGAKVAADLP